MNNFQHTNLNQVLAATLASTLIAAGQAHAGNIAYDGFSAGGNAPGPGQYATGGGFANDNLDGQGPTTTGFNAANPWQERDANSLVDGIYFQASDSSLNYSSDGGTHVLDTQNGSVRFLDNRSSFTKGITRDLVDKPIPGNESWYSVLLRYESTATWDSVMNFRLLQGGRDLSFEVTEDGELEVYTSNSSGAFRATVGDLSPNETHLLLMKMENEVSGSEDRISVWVDPELSDIGTADFDRQSNFLYVGNNSSFRFDTLQIDTDIRQNGVDQFFFDEFRLGTTQGDVLPFTVVNAIPEPGSVTVGLALGGLCLLKRRRRTS